MECYERPDSIDSSRKQDRGKQQCVSTMVRLVYGWCTVGVIVVVGSWYCPHHSLPIPRSDPTCQSTLAWFFRRHSCFPYMHNGHSSGASSSLQQLAGSTATSKTGKQNEFSPGLTLRQRDNTCLNSVSGTKITSTYVEARTRAHSTHASPAPSVTALQLMLHCEEGSQQLCHYRYCCCRLGQPPSAT